MNTSSKNILNKNQKTSLVLLLFLALWLFTPLFVMKFHLVNKTKLNGVADPKPYLKLNLKNLYNNDFQKSFENFFLKANPLFGYFVKINNELSYRLFKLITFSYGPEAFVGLDGNLLQPMYLNSFNRQSTPEDYLLVRKANKLKKLESLLAKKGVKLVVVVNPNNVSMYPDNVPERYLDKTRFERKNSYEIMKENIDYVGITFVDNYEFLMKKKNEFDFKFFEPTGSHLNEVGACLGTNNLLTTINSLLPDKDIKTFPCTPVTQIFPPKSEDIDLLKVSNLLFPNTLLKAGHYIPEPTKLYENAPLKLLFVGTSFNFATQNLLRDRNIAKSKLYFYYRTLRTDDGVFHELNKRKIDWENDVFKNDVIILESNYSGLGGVGYSFLTDAIIKLKKSLFSSKDELKAWQKEIMPYLIHQEKNVSKGNKQDTQDEFNPFKDR